MKKKSLIIVAAVLIGLVGGNYSCSQERELGLPANGLDVDRAVSQAQNFLSSGTGALSLPDTYYKADGSGSGTRTSENLSLLSGAIEPDWSLAQVWEWEGDIVTEVPTTLTRPVNYTTLIKERGDTISLTTQAPHTRIRAIESPDDVMYGFVITLLPDESYVGDLLLLGSNPIGSDYSGISIYSDLNGTPEWGYRYENGEIVNTLLFDAPYEDLPDLNIRVLMGFDGKSTTRANDNVIALDPIGITEKRPDVGEDAGSGDIPGGGGPPRLPNLPNNSGGGGGGSNNGSNPPPNPNPQNPLDVKVPNTQCVRGSIAAALQAKFGLSAVEALTKADAALLANGIQPIPIGNVLGIPVTSVALANTLRSLGFNIVGAINPPSSIISSNFNSGGWAIGYIPGSTGHEYFLTGYNSSSGWYTYYDSTGINGYTGTIRSGDIEEFLIK